jgi:hypothetical protein
MGDTTVQTGTQPTQQGDPAGQTTPTAQPVQQNGNGATPPVQGSSKDDEPLGPAGMKALKAERERVDALQNELKSLEPLKKLAAALGNGDAAQGKSEIEQLNEKFAQYEKDLAEERRGRLREQVARQFDLPDDLAELLKGANAEELKAHAETLQKYVPDAQKAGKKPGAPKPDRSQGSGQADRPSGAQQAKEQLAKRFPTKTT